MITFLVESILKNRNKPIDVPVLAKTYGLNIKRVSSILNKLDGLLVSEGIVRVTDPVKLVLSAYKEGADIKLLARQLSWKDFEITTATIFSEKGYAVLRNYRLAGQRRGEIDVIALDEECRIFAVDCKHWSYKSVSPSAFSKIVERAIERSLALSEDKIFSRMVCKKCLGIPFTPIIYTLIVTLYRKGYGFLDGVAIVPISSLSDFLASYHVFLDQLRGYKITCPQPGAKNHVFRN